MASSYVGRGFGNVAATAVVPSLPLYGGGAMTATLDSSVPAPQPVSLPPLFPVRGRETTDDFPTSINDMYRRRQHEAEDDDRRSEASSRRSSRSSGSRSRSSDRDEDDDRSDHRYHSSSYDTRKDADDEEEVEAEASFYDYRYLWATGLFLLLVAGLYFYWLHTYDCCATENEETNMTMQYAIDQFTRVRLAAGVSPSAVPSGEAEPGETAEGA